MSHLVLYGPPPDGIAAQWRKFLARADFVTHFVTPEYFAELHRDDGRPFALLCLAADEVMAVATGLCEGAFLRCGNSDRPQCILARDKAAEFIAPDLASGLKEIATANASKCVDLFTWQELSPLRAHGFMQRQRTGVVMLDLSLGPDALFRRFSGNKKTNIKKAAKLGVTVDMTSDPADISAYYRIYCDWSRRKGFPIVDERRFQEHLALTGNRRLFVARHEGRIVAGVIIRFAPGALVEFSANASLEAELHLRPNDLLQWHVIQWACAEGFPAYSLAGSHLFLRKFGGPLQPTFRYRQDRTVLRRYVLDDLSEQVVDGIKRIVPPGVIATAKAIRSRTKAPARSAQD